MAQSSCGECQSDWLSFDFGKEIYMYEILGMELAGDETTKYFA